MKNILDLVDGYKSYIAAIVISFLVFVRITGGITQETFELLVALVGGGSIAAIRHAVNKNGGKNNA